MASLNSLFLVLLFSGIISRGRSIDGRRINHTKALLLSRHHQRQAMNAERQPSSVDQRRRYRPAYPSTGHAVTTTAEGDEETASLAKRLVGLFRCSGWGPSCSRINDEGEPPKVYRLRQPSQRSYDAAAVDDRRTRTTARHSRPEIKFEPFFTLTSGSQTLYHQ